MRWTILTLVLWACVPATSALAEPCDELHEILSAVPHDSLTRSDGPFQSIWDGETMEGCEIEFETNDSTLAGTVAPDLFADPDTELFRSGWRMIPEILADGPGSGVHGIQKGALRCIVRWAQPAYIDDEGEHVQSETLTIHVQCGGDVRS